VPPVLAPPVATPPVLSTELPPLLAPPVVDDDPTIPPVPAGLAGSELQPAESASDATEHEKADTINRSVTVLMAEASRRRRLKSRRKDRAGAAYRSNLRNLRPVNDGDWQPRFKDRGAACAGAARRRGRLAHLSRLSIRRARWLVDRGV
jgi:hypothetical protein